METTLMFAINLLLIQEIKYVGYEIFFKKKKHTVCSWVHSRGNFCIRCMACGSTCKGHIPRSAVMTKKAAAAVFL